MRLKLKHVLITLLFFCQCNVFIYGQAKQIITGVIIDKKTKEILPFSSLRLKNHSIGTISDETGNFQFLIPEEITDDTLVVNHIGYNEFFVALGSTKESLKIKLEPNAFEINEAVILPLSAEEYLVRAVKRINQNYPNSPFQTVSYYREELTENSTLLHKKEGVFKSYYPISPDTLGNEHQLLLFREPGEVGKFAFMRHWIEKRQRKEKAKAEKEGRETKEEEEPLEGFNLGGPETILSTDLIKELPAFLDTNQFKEFKYFIGERTTFQGRNLITINFRSRGKVKTEGNDVNERQEGKILLDLESDAIVMVEQTAEFVIPFAARPILMALGLSVKNPVYNQTLKYEPVGDYWYPKDIHWNANVVLVKRHVARKKEYSAINLAQIFFVSEIKTTELQNIPKEKIFDPNKNMVEQVYNDSNLTWEEINVLKN